MSSTLDRPAEPDAPSIQSAAAAVAATRVVSIDALRGFDMFWIIGGYRIVPLLLLLLVDPLPDWLAYQFDHPDWVGFSAWDIIMPLFMFIVGAAMPFSFARRIEQGQSKGSIYRKVVL